jgi:phosphatidylglycerophosphatase A
LGTLRDPVHLVAFGFGAGLAPYAPGTFGSAVGVVAAWWLLELPLVARVAVVLGVVALGVWICGESARRLGRHDDQRIVFDEISTSGSPGRSAMWITVSTAVSELCLTT